MSIFQAFILGITQGLTEFLPISSSGHLIIFPWLFNFPDPGLSFDVSLHFGTLLAVLAFFWKDWARIFQKVLGINKDKNKDGIARKFLGFIIVATIPGAVAGYLFAEQAETILRSPLLIAATLSGMGIILWLADRWSLKKKSLDKMSWFDAILIGTAQALAIVPGVSRAGATMSAGLMREYSRVAAAKFSFLLMTPIVLGAAIFKTKEIMIIGSIDLYFIIGISTSVITGFLTIKFLLKFLEKNSYTIFAWYRLLLAAIIVIVWYFRR